MATRRYAAAPVALAAALVTMAAVPAAPRVPVYFLQGEQLVRVTRPAAGPADAVRQLIAGPTRAEAARGFRTYVPAGSRLRSVTVAGGLATVDLDARFASGRDSGSLLARLSQLVRTLTGLQGTTKNRCADRVAAAALRARCDRDRRRRSS